MITLLGSPESTNHIYKRHGHIIYLSKKGKDLKEYYQLEAKRQWKNPMTEKSLEVDIGLFFKDNRRRDIDNWNKILLDSLTGIVWKDDCQIQRMTISKAVDKKNPRVEIEIS